MEVMMASGKYELVHEYFEKMKRSGNAPIALTYKVLVKAFSKEGKVDEAVEAVRDMEWKGVVGAASVYCELAFCLSFNGMWEEAILEIKKMRRLPLTRPLVVTFTGMILSSMDGGHIGNVAFQSGKYTEAVEHYTAAISKSVKSHSFAAVCFCNRAAAHQSLGEIIDAIGDCSLAIPLDRSYPKTLSRRATLWEMIRDYKHATDDLQRLVSILETGENSQKSTTPGRTANGSVKDLRKARRGLSSIEEKSKKERSLDLYLILGVKPSDAAVEVKKDYRKAALRHHPDKAGQVLARAESGSDGQQWKVITESIQMDAEKIFKMIGKAYVVLSDSTKRSKYDLEEEMWDDEEVSFASTSRRYSDFYSSPYDYSNRRYTHESRKSYNSYSHYYPWEDSRKTY